ncbi:MAG: carboxypeptidase regulatory-like domain-containing protein [Calothrix sp. SM1_5_4]|nr:carboxypeptidase regulatory-like domain-containing protein [Calothrix sp. SM1_5_4]
MTLHVLGESGEAQLNQPPEPVADRTTEEIPMDRIKKTLELRGEETGKPVAGATILVSGFDASFVSDGAGQVELSLPPGRVSSLTVFHPKYQTRTLTGVEGSAP